VLNPSNVRSPKPREARVGICEADGVALVVENILIDCVDLDRMSAFWCDALDLEHVWTGPSGGYLLVAKDGSGFRLALMPCEELKTTKNRVHLDVRPDDQLAEIERLESLGAKRIDIGQVGARWVVMADPEGNEFCVLRSRQLPPRSDAEYLPPAGRTDCGKGTRRPQQRKN